ncbi:MAG: S-methyl-5'-thioadenosine phosphorylase [Candidatus Aureabacteria bacterium]|nr:S-methyl-5'-thioadenosine phosphorylase [Candidatus Auribacterota bacterium]
MTQTMIGVIGGSGFYQMEGLTVIEEVKVETPFGGPSDVITIGGVGGERIAFIPRHGRGHTILPTEVPSRANIFALKSLGVEQIIAFTVCGSMREEIAPLHIVIPDQIFDHTKKRASTFFGNGLVAHISFADPFCSTMSELLYASAKKVGAKVHKGGCLMCIEGPQYSSKGESNVYRKWGVDIIGMTVMPEAKLAREAEICYSSVALVTDYDVWHETEEPVTTKMVIANLQKNIATAKRILLAALPTITRERSCSCATALRDAIFTQRDCISARLRDDLAPLIGKYSKD